VITFTAIRLQGPGFWNLKTKISASIAPHAVVKACHSCRVRP